LTSPGRARRRLAAGIVVSFNQGQVAPLSPEAPKLFTTLKPVIPMN
jgi:hypothetical protein